MIQAIYFQHMPAHLRPKRAKCEAQANRACRGSERDTSGVYAKANEPEHYFKRKVLPVIEAARKRGDIVRFVGNSWLINGHPLEV
jgi:hypothetical protein